jgi:nucleoside-diphosphate-sugar epimerase
MLSIAVVGAKGYVGSAVYEELLKASKHSVFAVTRDNYVEMKEQSFDILINCAMPSGRFWAKNNPEEDFLETVKKTADLLYGWKYKKFVQISTVSARCQLDTVYGRHKASAENLCNFGENLIVRLGALYGNNMKKGVLVDMLKGKKVFVDGASRYSFISVSFCAYWIASNLHHQGIVELGGKNAVSLKDVAKHMGVSIEFEGDLNHQDIENTEDQLPEASEVLGFMSSLKGY